MLICRVEKPQVDIVQSEWQTASNSVMPPNLRQTVCMAVSTI